MNSRKIKLAAIMLWLIANGTVQAVLTGAGKFDQLIENATIIIKGRVARIDKPPFEMIAFKADVIEALKTDGGEISTQLYFEAPFPLWPDDLGIPFAQGQCVLLVLHRANGKIYIENNQGAILPATSGKLNPDANSSATRKVFEELWACLDPTQDQTAKGLLLVHLSQLGTKEDEKKFLPYMKSENQWLRRGALASLIRINLSPDLINQAIDDFSQHLSAPSDEFLFWKMYVNVQWSAKCGSFGMDKELTTRAKAYLPIYRALIDKAPSGYQHVSVAINALKDVGISEDISRLYKYIDNDKAWIRHDVLEGISRILGMKVKRPAIPAYGEPLSPEVKAWEAETRSVIDQKLASEHILSR